MHLDFMRRPESALPPVPEAGRYLSLRIWHCKFRSLAPVAAFVNLERLVIATYPDKTLDVLSRLTRLRSLSILHFPQVDDLEPLARLESLEDLSLSTLPSWDTSRRRITVRSLEPLSRLQRLTRLELFGVSTADRSLASLAASRSIKAARFSGYPDDEVRKFYAATAARKEFTFNSDA